VPVMQIKLTRLETLVAATVLAATCIGCFIFFRTHFDYTDEVAMLRYPGATMNQAVEFFGEPSTTVTADEYRRFLLSTDWRSMHPAPGMPDFSGVSKISIFYAGPSEFHIGQDTQNRVKFVYHGET
jgi:hypothetical protein